MCLFGWRVAIVLSIRIRNRQTRLFFWEFNWILIKWNKKMALINTYENWMRLSIGVTLIAHSSRNVIHSQLLLNHSNCFALLPCSWSHFSNMKHISNQFANTIYVLYGGMSYVIVACNGLSLTFAIPVDRWEYSEFMNRSCDVHSSHTMQVWLLWRNWDFELNS